MYTVTYTDNSTFAGGTLQDSKWNTMPNKKIQSIIYKLNQGKRIRLSGFSEYNQIVEKVRFANKSGEQITKFIVMAKYKEYTYQLIVDFQKNTISQKKVLVDTEYMGKPVNGWKQGSMTPDPYFKLED